MDKTMKAFRWHGKGKLKLEEVRVPKVRDTDVLIEVNAMGICGSEVSFRHDMIPIPEGKIPRVGGHEFAGTVVERGPKVTQLNQGDKVSARYTISCGDCTWCNRGMDNLCTNRGSIEYDALGYEGGFAEYCLLPARNAFRLPDGIPMEQAAIIGCAVTTALHAVKVRGGLKTAESVAVCGLGGIGLHAIQWANVLGAKKIIGVDVNDFKLRTATKFGASETIDARDNDTVKKVHEITGVDGVDIVIDTVGSERTIDQALRSVGPAGRVVVVGLQGGAFIHPLQVNLSPILWYETNLTGSIDHTRDDHQLAIEYVASQKYDLSKSVTHKLPFEKLNEAIDILEEGKQDIIRIVCTR